jgi:hypothetical protein
MTARLVAAAQQRYPELAQLATRETARDDRIFRHKLLGSLLVGGLEDGDPGVGLAQRWASQDQLAVSQEPLKPREVPRPYGLFFVGHGRREVFPWRVEEVDPFSHALSLPAGSRFVNVVPSGTRFRFVQAACRRGCLAWCS